MHIKSGFYDKARDITRNNQNKKVIVLGDFNAHTTEQADDKKESKEADYIREMLEQYNYCGKHDKNGVYGQNHIIDIISTDEPVRSKKREL